MVQMTHARTFNPKTGEWGEVTAKAYKHNKDRFRAMEAAGEMECHCPDPRCDGVRVRHHDDHLQMFYSDRGSYQLDIPSHFQRWPGAPAHHKDCSIAQQYGVYEKTMHNLGALSLGNAAYIVNLNVPTRSGEGPVRKPVKIVSEFNGNVTRTVSEATPKEKRPLSHGIRDLKAMGALIEKAAYDEKFRRNVLFRRSSDIFSLEDLYQEKPRQLFKAAQQAHNKLNRDYIGALTVFQPAALPKFWQKRAGMIMGQPEVVKGRDGQNHHVAMALHVENRALFASLREEFNKGNKSFLVYSDKIYVDADEVRARNDAARAGGENKAFMVHVHIVRSEQVVPWAAPPPQKILDLGNPLFDVRQQPEWDQRRRGSGIAASSAPALK